jgi:cellobiose phosphorylase
MEAVDRHLVRRETGIIQLLDPPFDRSALNPGYIKGYVPGVRENGGQYTHAAIWTAMAFARLGDAARAWKLLDMINPVNHARTAEQVAVYKTEPYVVSADVYAVSPHTGRGGWSWYTGSAGWLYRFLLETLLGLVREGDRLYFRPCLPPTWESFTINYRYGETVYRIMVLQAEGESEELVVDGAPTGESSIFLTDDRRAHEARWRISKSGSPLG